MKLKPSHFLSDGEVSRGLNLVVKDGLVAEAMTALTGGTFLVALALQLGASNFQIGLLAALPTLTNVFQLVAIWLVQRYNNRRAIAVVATLFARFPLLLIGAMPLIFSTSTSIHALIFILFFHYFFGSISGASWNSWMKDLVPEEKLGSFFSHRIRLTQSLNVVLSLILALGLDYVKKYYPGFELPAYSIMFILGGLIGLTGAYLLARTPEPQSTLAKENLMRVFSKPLRDRNFRKLLVFNSGWSFAINLAAPFFSVYMMNTLKLPLSYIIGFGILGQFAGILALRAWGKYSDRYSNKTIIRIAAPFYIFCIMAWSVVTIPQPYGMQLLLIGLVNMLSGAAVAGINLALTNIGLKLAPRDGAIAYISVKNMTVAFVSALGPLAGGWMADRMASVSVKLPFVTLHNWNFLFLAGGVLAIVAVRLLKRVEEKGEVNRVRAMSEMRVVFRERVEQRMKKQPLLAMLFTPVTYSLLLRRKMKMHYYRRYFSRTRRRLYEQQRA